MLFKRATTVLRKEGLKRLMEEQYKNVNKACSYKILYKTCMLPFVVTFLDSFNIGKNNFWSAFLCEKCF
jgi:hypothetical protein